MSELREAWRALKRLVREERLVADGVPRLPMDRPVPPPGGTERADGICAVGGGLEPERVLAAYAQGAFPWFGPGEPVLWRAPRVRYVLELSQHHVPQNLARIMRKGTFEVTLDRAFDQVIVRAAQKVRPGGDPSWIDARMLRAYTELHRAGHAHSVECWKDGELVAGAYGLARGAVFFGESSFSAVDNGGSVAMATLHEKLREWGFHFVDCQTHSRHLERFGQVAWSRARFLARLAEATRTVATTGPWMIDGPSPLALTAGAAMAPAHVS